jgi:hypothetical protein
VRRPRSTFLRIAIPIGVVAIALGQAASSAYQRYLRCQGKADDLALSESLYRRKAGVCEEMAPRLREVAALARELSGSATGDFERKRWLEMAQAEERKAAEADREAVRLIRLSDEMAARAYATSRLALRPWLAEPD